MPANEDVDQFGLLYQLVKSRIVVALDLAGHLAGELDPCTSNLKHEHDQGDEYGERSNDIAKRTEFRNCHVIS